MISSYPTEPICLIQRFETSSTFAGFFDRGARSGADSDRLTQ